MKKFYGRPEFSCIHVDCWPDPDHEHRVRGLPTEVPRVAEMILWKMIKRSGHTADECMGIGVSRAESEQILLHSYTRHLHATRTNDLEAARAYAKARLRTYLLNAWAASHHRN